MNRRSFLQTMLACAAAPAVVKASSLMRVKPIVLPGDEAYADIIALLNRRINQAYDSIIMQLDTSIWKDPIVYSMHWEEIPA